MTQRNLTINDDGTVTVPLKGRDDVILEEPSMDQLAKAHALVAEADTKTPTIPIAPADPNLAYLQAVSRQEAPAMAYDTDAATWYAQTIADVRQQADQRARVMFGPDHPHGTAFLEIVRAWSEDETINDGHLYGWAMHWRTCNKLLEHFTAPLDGEESMSAPAPASTLAQPAATPDSGDSTESSTTATND